MFLGDVGTQLVEADLRRLSDSRLGTSVAHHSVDTVAESIGVVPRPHDRRVLLLDRRRIVIRWREHVIVDETNREDAAKAPPHDSPPANAHSSDGTSSGTMETHSGASAPAFYAQSPHLHQPLSNRSPLVRGSVGNFGDPQHYDVLLVSGGSAGDLRPRIQPVSGRDPLIYMFSEPAPRGPSARAERGASVGGREGQRHPRHCTGGPSGGDGFFGTLPIRDG